jgi:hypothetical protein
MPITAWIQAIEVGRDRHGLRSFSEVDRARRGSSGTLRPACFNRPPAPEFFQRLAATRVGLPVKNLYSHPTFQPKAPVFVVQTGSSHIIKA